MTRPRRAWWVRFPHSPASVFVLAAFFAAVVFSPSEAQAQRPDTVTAAPHVPGVIIRGPNDSLKAAADTPSVVRISPRRAFLTSLVVPGYMQIRFGRPKAATIFLAAEAGTIGMSVKSWRDLDAAKAAKRDSVFTPVLDNLGKPVIDSVTGKPKTVGEVRNKNLADRVQVRRTHLEDWIAGLIFNHLFAGADAFVAANLADFNTNVRVTSTGRGVRVLASVAW